MVNKGEKIMKFMCEAAAGGSNIAIYVILIVMVLAMLILPYFSNKKRNQQYMEMINGIKVGSVVKTAGGVIGRVTKITDKGDIKTVILETGSKTEKSYMEFDMTMIYCVLKSTKVAEDNDKTETEEVEAKAEVVEEKPEEVETKAEIVEEKTEKPATKKKTTAKKTTAKTTKKN